MWNLKEYVVISNDITGKRFIIRKKKIKTIISGKIIYSNNIKISDAIIKIEKIDYNYNPCRISLFGYTLCDCNGNYAVVVDKTYRVYYKLSVYQILKNNI